MNLTQKISAVESVFGALDAGISAFQSDTTLHCKAGCGKCCFKSDLEATILEFLPFAKHLHATGRAMEWLEKLQAQPSPVCVILDPLQSGFGLCSDYPHRGLICRLFGYSARRNKYDQKELITCQIIKTEQAPAYDNSVKIIGSGGSVPAMSDYYMQLHGIDADLTREFFPINDAIRKAIETVLQYYAYRDEDAL